MKKTSRGNSLSIGGVTLVPVIEESINHWQCNGLLSVWGTKNPIGIVVQTQSARLAFRITGEEVSVEELVGSS
jgi:hypothetical protein